MWSVAQWKQVYLNSCTAELATKSLASIKNYQFHICSLQLLTVAKRTDLQGSLVQHVQEMLTGSTGDKSTSDRPTSNESADDNLRWKLIITETMEDVLSGAQGQVSHRSAALRLQWCLNVTTYYSSTTHRVFLTHDCVNAARLLSD